MSAWRGIDEGEREQDENESRDDRTSGQPRGDVRRRRRMRTRRRMKNAACRLRHVTLFYSFFGPVVALMSSYARRGRDRSATRPDITSRAMQLRAKGPSCDLRGDGIRTDGGERAIYSGTASPRADDDTERTRNFLKRLRFDIVWRNFLILIRSQYVTIVTYSLC